MSAVRLDGLEDILEFWTPSEVKNYVTTVANGFSALAADIQANPTVFDATQTVAWSTDLAAFIAFFKNVGFFSTLSMGAVRTAEGYASKLQYWRDLFAQKSGKSATGSAPPIPSSNQDKAIDTVKLLTYVAGIAATGYVLAQIVKIVRR
jgi:hypothetical protein